MMIGQEKIMIGYNDDWLVFFLEPRTLICWVSSFFKTLLSWWA